MDDADSMYADLRRRGQITVGHYSKHLIPLLRYRAKRDGLKLAAFTPRPARRRGPFIGNQTPTSVTILDDAGHVYAPDSAGR